MIGRKEAQKIVQQVFKETKADQAEVIIFNYDQALTRFANNYIHQNVNELNTSISIRVIFGKKIGVAATNSLDAKKIKETVKWAEEIARYQKENTDFVSLPVTELTAYKKIKLFAENTSQITGVDRARAVAEIVDVAKKYELVGYGTVSNGAAEICVGNSLGTFAYTKCNDVFCSIVMSGSNSSGYARFGSNDAADIDYHSLAELAAQKAMMSADPIEFPPGQFTTIFEPLAASEFLYFLGYYAFNAKLFQEGRSYLSDRLGSKIMDERITIVDDPFDKRGFPFPFDFEGVSKQRIVLIDKGIAKNVVYDSLTAAKAKVESTGHALAAPNPFGPVPMHLAMEGGKDSFDKMVKDTKKGILVTRFHYTNMIDPHKLIFTGMTRDGTFLVEDGKVTKGLKNLRFTENMIEVLNRVEAISKDPILVASEPGYGARFGMGTVNPALKVRDFAFTSATDF